MCENSFRYIMDSCMGHRSSLNTEIEAFLRDSIQLMHFGTYLAYLIGMSRIAYIAILLKADINRDDITISEDFTL